MERTWRVYVGGLQVICATLLLWIVGVTLVNVLMRYVFQQAITWADEAARLSFIVFTFVAAGLAAASQSHLVIDTLEQRLEHSPRMALFLAWLRGVTAVAFCVLLIYGGVNVAVDNLGQASPALRISLGLVYFAMPLGGLLILIGFIGNSRFPDSRRFAAGMPEDDESGEGESNDLGDTL